MRGSSAPNSAISHTSTAVNSPKPTPVDPAVKELTEQLAALALVVKGLTLEKQTTAITTSATPAAAPPRPKRIPRCIWCDSREHSRRSECNLFAEALKVGHIKINENNRIAFTSTNVEIPPAFGRGGMKMMYELVHPPASVASPQGNVRTITFDDGGEMGGDTHSTSVSTKEKGEWIDVDVEEKRKREDGRFQRNARRKIDGAWQTVPDTSQTTPAGTGQPASAPLGAGQSPTMPASNGSPASQTQSQPGGSDPGTMDIDSDAAKPKYRLQSELGKTISITDVAEKIMNAPIQLSIKEFLAVSPEMSGYIHEQTRRKRVLRDGSETTASSNEIDADVQTTAVIPGGKACRPFSAVPSGRALVVLDDKVRTESLLDDGSELNLMDRGVYEELDHPIDENINWRINGYGSKAQREMEERYGIEHNDVLGVLHNVVVDVGGVEVKQHIFVVSHLPAKLILGRPWGRSTRAKFINEDDGSYTVCIRSPDDLKEVRFTASPADHERNRDTVRSKD